MLLHWCLILLFSEIDDLVRYFGLGAPPVVCLYYSLRRIVYTVPM
jgi:hypothetical protein